MSDETPTSPDTPKTEQKKVAVWFGYGRNSMRDFNSIQVSQGNRSLKGGFNAGAEFSPRSINLPATIPLIGGTSVSIPVGLEYLDAATKTTHTVGGNSATVAWNLPAYGIYISPEITSSRFGWLSLKPVEVGYYFVGDLFDADLTVSDRPGRLKLTARSVGAKSEVTIRPIQGKRSLFASLGYRWLRFSDVKQEPVDGFQYSPGGTASAPGALQQNLDYSGLFGQIGMTIAF